MTRSFDFWFTVRTVYFFDYDNIVILIEYYLQYYLITKRRNRRIFTTFRSESTCFQLTIDRNKKRLCYIADMELSRRNRRFLAFCFTRELLVSLLTLNRNYL